MTTSSALAPRTCTLALDGLPVLAVHGICGLTCGPEVLRCTGATTVEQVLALARPDARRHGRITLALRPESAAALVRTRRSEGAGPTAEAVVTVSDSHQRLRRLRLLNARVSALTNPARSPAPSEAGYEHVTILYRNCRSEWAD
ncbi:hypothetical protein [Kitasatospora sp. NPDC089509]|uniref:hypothetical protein n=1 Tax=Kitasatospora sp. NPDC089509 TaxID=3364079 RepID=UPI0037FC2371